MDFKNFSDLEKYLTKQIQDSLKTDVKNDGENLIESHIVKDVYAEIYPWEPKVYDRTFNLIEKTDRTLVASAMS